MRNYWFKILRGRPGHLRGRHDRRHPCPRGIAGVTRVVASDQPLTIPLSLIPFELQGERLGKLDHVTLMRKSPNEVTAVELEIQLADSLVARGLAGCRLAANMETKGDSGVNIHVGPRSPSVFYCAGDDRAGGPAGVRARGAPARRRGDSAAAPARHGQGASAPRFRQGRSGRGRGSPGGFDRGRRRGAGATRSRPRCSGHSSSRARIANGRSTRSSRRPPSGRLAAGGRIAPGGLGSARGPDVADSSQAPVIFGAMLLVLDNYDSFTYNLVQYAGELGADPVVYRNDALSVEAALALAARRHRHLARPLHARARPASRCRWSRGRRAAGVPLLGVCLGHQAIGEAFGGRVVRADRLMHGKTTMVAHTGHPLFRGVPVAVRGHALPLAGRGARRAARRSSRSPPGRPTGPAGSEIMALCHRALPVYGVQFHPESVGTARRQADLCAELSSPWPAAVPS